MAKETPKENLTEIEKAELNAFIVKCVLNNAGFPSEKIGTSKVTIQQLINEHSVNTLINFGDFIEKKLTANGSSFKSKMGVLRYNNVPATELVSALHSIIKYKEYEEELEARKERMKEVANLLENLKTPTERRTELEAEMLLLKGQ